MIVTRHYPDGFTVEDFDAVEMFAVELLGDNVHTYDADPDIITLTATNAWRVKVNRTTDTGAVVEAGAIEVQW